MENKTNERRYHDYELRKIEECIESYGDELGELIADKIIKIYDALVNYIITTEEDAIKLAARINPSGNENLFFELKTLEYFQARVWECSAMRAHTKLVDATAIIKKLTRLEREYSKGTGAHVNYLRSLELRELREILDCSRAEIDLIHRKYEHHDGEEEKKPTRDDKRRSKLLHSLMVEISDALDEEIGRRHYENNSNKNHNKARRKSKENKSSTQV